MYLLRRKVYGLGEALISGFQLKKLKREIEASHRDQTPPIEERLKAFLKKWDLGPNLQDVTTQSKEEVRDLFVKNNAGAKAAKFAYTGGSTGIPLKIPLSRRQDLIRKASMSFYNSLAGYHLGDPYLFVRVKDRGWLEKKLRREYAFLPQKLSEQTLEALYETLTEKRVEIIIGHASVGTRLSEYLIKKHAGGTLPNVRGIITCSEPLTAYQTELMRIVFTDATILSRYSNEEVGVIAHQFEPGGPLVTDKFSTYVEVVDPISLKPVKAGESGIVLVTDLFSEIFPICRYQTGDIAVVDRFEDGYATSIRAVSGRTVEQIFSALREPVSSLSLGPSIHKPLSNEGILCRYQFTQLSEKVYKVNFSVGDSKVPAVVIGKIEQGLKEILGEEAIIRFTFQEEFVRRDSGKTPIYVNKTLFS